MTIVPPQSLRPYRHDPTYSPASIDPASFWMPFFNGMSHCVSTLQSRNDAFDPRQSHKGIQAFLVGNSNALGSTNVLQEAVL
jgi:hypothetical protein